MKTTKECLEKGDRRKGAVRACNGGDKPVQIAVYVTMELLK
jgi:hypothetical protein